MIAYLADQYGWRGCWLVTIGLSYVVFGVGVSTDPGTPRAWVPYDHTPAWVLATGWILTASVAMWQGTRGRVTDDSWGHVALYLMPGVRMLSYVISIMVYVVTSVAHAAGINVNQMGYGQAWYGALVWGLFVGALAIAARWPNPRPPLVSPPQEVP